MSISRWIRVVTVTVLMSWVCQQASARNLVFDDKTRDGAIKQPEFVTVFFDRQGNLYPGPEINIDVADLVPVIGKDMGPEWDQAEDPVADIKKYFSYSTHADQWQKMQKQARVDDGKDFSSAWSQVQSWLRSRIVDDIKAAAHAGGPDRKIVFLIHGYNNDFEASTQWYGTTIAKIRELTKQDPLFVRVYWDGLYNGPFMIWGRAQRNAPFVGVGLRQLLLDLDGAMPAKDIVMFTHSTGALVAVNALGNGLGDNDAGNSKIFDCSRMTDACDGIRSLKEPSGHRYRLGLMAPAASPNIFDSFNDRNQAIRLIALVTNRKDYATSKMFLPCSQFGSTCLNARPERTCRTLQEKFGNTAITRTAFFELSDSAVGKRTKWVFWEDHQAVSYLEHADKIERVVTALFGDIEPVDDDTRETCGRLDPSVAGFAR